MARIIDLDAVVPEDIEFNYRGDTFAIPGDIDVEQTFRIIRMFEEAQTAEEEGASLDVRERLNLIVRDELLALFQVRDPELIELPFGTIAYQHVLVTVLTQLGLQVMSPEAVNPPTPKTPTRAIPKSRRSSGSPSS
jgi:hypothetical protein